MEYEEQKQRFGVAAGHFFTPSTARGLSPTAAYLYLFLLHEWSRNNCQHYVRVSDFSIKFSTGLGQKAIEKARDCLIYKGMICFRPVPDGGKNEYELFKL